MIIYILWRGDEQWNRSEFRPIRANNSNEMKQMENKTVRSDSFPEFACSRSDTVMDLSSDKFFSLIRNVAFPIFLSITIKMSSNFSEDFEVNK